MDMGAGESDEQSSGGLQLARFPLAVGVILGTAVTFIALIVILGPADKDQWLTNALYGFSVAVPTVLLAYIWSGVDRGAQRAPTLMFFLGAWATIFGVSCAMEHFDGGAGAFFYVLCALCMAMLVVVVPSASRASRAKAKAAARQSPLRARGTEPPAQRLG
jgi:hypothetical protein